MNSPRPVPFFPGVSTVQKTDAERLKDMKLVILRDVGLLLLAGQILYATKRLERA